MISHKISVSDEPLAINEVKCRQEPLSIGRVKRCKKHAQYPPSPA